jgi:hypothetical protein
MLSLYLFKNLDSTESKPNSVDLCPEKRRTKRTKWKPTATLTKLIFRWETKWSEFKANALF